MHCPTTVDIDPVRAVDELRVDEVDVRIEEQREQQPDEKHDIESPALFLDGSQLIQATAAIVMMTRPTSDTGIIQGRT